MALDDVTGPQAPAFGHALARLVRTPEPHDTESFFGYLLRLSEVNGYETPQHIAHVAMVERGAELSARYPVERLAQVIGQSAEKLARIAYRCRASKGVRHGGFKILDHDLGGTIAGVLRLRNPALCVPCVEEREFIDTFWDLTVAVACPKHGRRSLRECHACGEKLRWARPGLLICACGAQFPDEGSAEAAPATVELLRYIDARLHQRQTRVVTDASSGFPVEHLDAVPFGSLLRMLSTLGAHACSSSGAKQETDDARVDAAAAALDNWPQGYHELLRTLGSQISRRGSPAIGLRKQFESFYTSMFRNRMFSAHVGFLRDEFISFGCSHWGNGLADRRLHRSVAERRFVSKTEYARRFGVSGYWIQQAIADGKLVTNAVKQKRTRIVIDLHLSQVPHDAGVAITAREAARHLGLPVSVMEALRVRGTIETRLRTGRQATWYASDVEEFQSRCLRLAGDRSITTDAKDQISLASLMSKKFRRPDTKADIVAAMIDGTLPFAGRAGDRPGDLLIATQRLEPFLHDLRAGVTKSYPVKDALKLMGIREGAMAAAVKLGVLSVTRIKGRPRITASSVDEFNQLYVTLAQVAKELGTHSATLVDLCRRKRIPSISLAIPVTAGKRAHQTILPRSSEPLVVQAWEDSKRSQNGLVSSRQGSSHVARLTKYLEELRARSESLPRRSGRPRMFTIEKACGFWRGQITAKPELLHLVEVHDDLERESAWCATSPVRKLDGYLRDFHVRHRQILCNNDARPNLKAIARGAGFDRKEFYREPALLERIREFLVQQITRQSNLLPRHSESRAAAVCGRR